MVEHCSIKEGAEVLAKGDPVIFPTETVCGVGVSVEAASSPAELFKLKNRPLDKPVSWLVAHESDLSFYGDDVPEYAFALARAFWPGPLTMVVRASAEVPDVYQSKHGTIGLRMPSGDTVLTLIEQAGAPLATTSANPNTMPAPDTLEDIDPDFAEAVGYVVTEGADEPKSGVASTVVDCTGSVPIVLREGGITLADIQELLDEE